MGWYDGATRTVELTSQTAVWYRSGKPPVPLRWVLIRDPQGAFASAGLAVHRPVGRPTQILQWFVLRWQLEVTFQEVRTHLGVETHAPVVRPGHRPHHAGPAGLFSLDHLPLTCCKKVIPWSTVRAACTTSRRQPSWMPLPWCDATVAGVGGFPRSPGDTDTQELPAALYHRLVDSLAYAA